MDESQIGLDLEGSGHVLTEILFRHFPGGSQENRGKYGRIIDALAEIQAEHSLNAILAQYSSTTRFQLLTLITLIQTYMSKTSRNHCLLEYGRCFCDVYKSYSVWFPCLSTQLSALRLTQVRTCVEIPSFTLFF
jgi:hypothetical protein